MVRALHDHLAAGDPARRFDWKARDVAVLRRELSLLSDKPVLYAANVAETDLPDGNDHVDVVRKIAQDQGAEVVVISAQVEAELAELDADERAEFLDVAGVAAFRTGADSSSTPTTCSGC